MCCSFLVRIIVSFNYEKMMHVAISVTLGQLWLASIQSSRRGRSETATGGFASPLSYTTPSLSRHEVESSSRRRTAPPPSRQEEALSDDSVEMWVIRRTAPPPLRLVTPPTRLVAPSPLTHVQEVSFDNSLLSDSSGYNDKCPHVKEVSSYEHVLDFNCTKCAHVHFRFKS
jgi:hypothetical protein